MKGSTSTAGGRPLEAARTRGSWKRAGRLACLGAAVSFTQGCSSSDADGVAQGRALYEANCLMCHGEGALGDGPMASGLPVPPPSLFEHLGHHTRAHLIQLIEAGLPPAMPPTALSQEEIASVVDYVWTLVPESEVAELRAMQEQMEMTGDSTMEAIPGMEEMDHSQHMPGAEPDAMPMETTQ